LKPQWVLLPCLAAAACAGQRPLPARDVFPIATSWSVPMGDEADITGALASDGGRVFVATSDGRVHGLDRFTGATLWQVGGRPGVLSLSGATLVLREEDGTVWSMDPATGSARWKAESRVAGALPALVAGDRIVVAGEGLAALDAADGRVVWTDPAARAAVAPIAAGGGIVVGEADGRLYLRDLAAGTARWQSETSRSLEAPPVADDRGHVLAGTTDRLFVSVDGGSGKERWTWRLGADVGQPPALFEDVVLFATFEDVLYALDRGNGHLRWRAPLPSRPQSGPVVFGGAVVVACHGARPGETFLIGYDARTGERQGDFKVAGEARTPPLLVEDRLYVGMRERADRVVSLHLGAAEAGGP
jgi:outer membrane protein assembly factor BamB